MIRIYKYQLDWQRAGTHESVRMPKGASILKAGNQNNQVMLWAEIDDTQLMETRVFAICGTGWEIPANASYIDTVLVNGGGLVWHVYEVEQ